MAWTQAYAPLGSLGLSALVAAAPLVVIFALLASGKLPGWASALAALVAALALAVGLWGMPTVPAAASALLGVAFAILPILWIVVSALWVHELCVASGQFDLIRSTLASITSDRRLQALFIAFAFGAFLEGAGGFGTPVAITVAMLVGLGFESRPAATICLLANSSPVAFAAAGVPVAAAAAVSGIGRDPAGADHRTDGHPFDPPCSAVAVRGALRLAQEHGGPAGHPGCGGPFRRHAASHLDLQRTVDSRYPFGHRDPGRAVAFLSSLEAENHVGLPRRRLQTNRQLRPAPGLPVLRAWAPYLLMSLLVLLWAAGPVRHALQRLDISFAWPLLDGRVMRAPPVVPSVTPYRAEYSFAVFSAPGTAIFLAGFLSMFILPGMGLRKGLACLGKTLFSLWRTMAMVCLVLATAYVMNFSGMNSSLGLALAATGAVFPLFSPLLGWLGVLLSGSDTSSNALFGSLQRTTAEHLGLNPGPDRGGECHRRRGGQDDLPAEHLSGHRLRQAPTPGRRDPQVHHRAQRGHGPDRQRHHHDSRVPAARR